MMCGSCLMAAKTAHKPPLYSNPICTAAWPAMSCTLLLCLPKHRYTQNERTVHRSCVRPMQACVHQRGQHTSAILRYGSVSSLLLLLGLLVAMPNRHMAQSRITGAWASYVL
jgi:hypothetical protein